MKSLFQFKCMKIKEIQIKMNPFQGVPDLSWYHYVSSTTIRLHFRCVHLTNNMSFVSAGVKLIERNRCFVLSKQEIRKINGFQ